MKRAGRYRADLHAGKKTGSRCGEWTALVVMVAGLFVAGTSSLRGEGLSAKSAGAPTQVDMQEADAIQDILFCTPRQPFLIRLHLYVNGAGFRQLRRQWADERFRALDADKSGALEGDELKQIPAAASLRPGLTSESALVLAADSDPADGKVTLAEFQHYVLAATGTPFSIQSLDAPRGRIVFNNNNDNVQVNLFPKLDTDRDGKLSRQEIEAAATNLRRYDRNEDDVVENGELQRALPEEQANSQQQLAGVLGMLYVVDTLSGGTANSRRLLEGYDKASRDPATKLFRKDERLSRTELPLEPEVFARADKNGDGKLDRTELATLTAVMTPVLELEIQAPAADKSFTVKSLRQVDPALVALLDVQTGPEGNCVLKIDDTVFALRAASAPAGYDSQLRKTYLDQFKMLDQDKNDYLDFNEMRSFNFNNAFFSQADTDNDAKVFENEYAAQIDREIGLSLTSLTWEVSSDGKSLFRLLDTSPADGRLSLRELSEAPSKLAKWDTNGDDVISLAELSIQLDATFKSGAARVNGPFNASEQPAGVASTNVTDSVTKILNDVLGVGPPLWFTKMDRNGDGDLSPKEFLGRRALFDKIDKNGDGLINAIEARSATRAALAKP